MIRSNGLRILLWTGLALLLVTTRASAADWPMLGRDRTRNPVSPEKNPPTDWDIETGKNIRWRVPLGSMTHGTPVVADGRVYIGTNNGHGYLERFPKAVDLGCLLCFRESDGEFLWQYSATKLPTGRVHDWPLQGIGSSPLVEGERMWFVSNRWEVVCLDTLGFRDGENDGPVQDEPVESLSEADIVWEFDLIQKLGVFPHNQGMGPTRRCSPAASYQNRIYVLTGNGVDESHINIPKPDAPSLVCLDKRTGKVMWTDNSPGANILHGQFSSPLVAEIGGRAQVIVPQGDGWIRSFDALSGDLIWKFDVNRKDARWLPGGRGDRNHVLAAPVLYQNRVYVATGQEVEHGEGLGRLVCLDPTKTGDISVELAVDRRGEILPHRRRQAVDPKKGERAIPNPNSGLIWEFVSAGDDFEGEMHRTIATVAIHEGLLIATDFSGLVRCLDAETGKRRWYYDCFAAIWSSPLIVGQYLYVADEDGDLAVFHLSSAPDGATDQEAHEHQPLAEIDVGNGVAGSPVFANGTLYVATRTMLFAIAQEPSQADVSDGASPDGYWPQWRGPHQDNRSRENGLLKTWSETGPPLLWRADGLGEGIASVSIADGRIVTICQRDDIEYIRALDEETGRHLWTARLGKAVPQNPLMRWFTQRAPTLGAGHVYAVSLLGELVCLRARDGTELWRRSYPEQFHGERPVFGYADSPLIDGENLICTPGGVDASVVALNRNSGDVVWTCAVPDCGRASHTSGMIANIGGERQFVTFFESALVGIGARDGNLLWRDDSSGVGYGHPNTPLVDENKLVLINAGRSGCRQIRITRSEIGFQVEQTQTVRSSHFDRFYEGAFLIDRHVYELTRVGTCIDTRDGSVVWKERLSRRPAAATWADGRFYLHDTDGMMKLYRATPAGTSLQGSFQLADHVPMSGATAPVVAGGRLYVREDDRLFCFEVRCESAERNAREPQRVTLPDLQQAATALQPASNPANDSRRIVNSVFSPTPHDVVAKMLRLAEIDEEDVVYDLGSGDGRILISAAEKYGCRAVGFEIDPEQVKRSRQHVEDAELAGRVTVHHADLFNADVSKASVVCLYLLPYQNKRLIPQLQKLPAEARVVTHQFAIPGAVADKVIDLESKDSGESHRLFVYTAPLKLE